MNHGVYVTHQATSTSTPVTAESGIPFVVGTSPIQAAESAVTANTPTLCTSFEDFEEKFGYSTNWTNYTLCEFAYSHFNVFNCQPVIFVNVLDLTTDKETGTAADLDVTSHKISVGIEAINDANLIVKAEGGTGDAYIKGTDYSVYYEGEYCIIELLSTSTHYSETKLNVIYNKAKPTSLASSKIVAGINTVDDCLTTCGIVPDLLLAPGFSNDTSVAAALAAKAGGINEMFKALALCDIDADATTSTVSAAVTKKTALGLTLNNEVACWPMAKIGTLKFHLSTITAGVIASTDYNNDGVPFESPSNKLAAISGLCLSTGTEVSLNLGNANVLNGAGIVTALNFINGWCLWGNYTAAYPTSSSADDIFIPVKRMFGWVGNSVIKSFWKKIDRPMNRRLIDSIVDSVNIWLNSLVGSGYVVGARCEFLDSDNPLANLLAGKVKIRIYMAPPSPMQELSVVLEYDSSYISTSLQA